MIDFDSKTATTDDIFKLCHKHNLPLKYLNSWKQYCSEYNNVENLLEDIEDKLKIFECNDVNELLKNNEFLDDLLDGMEGIFYRHSLKDILKPEQYVESSVTSLKGRGSNELDKYLTLELLPFVQTWGQKCQGVTIDHNPHIISKDDAWANVIPYLHGIIDRLRQVDEINFIIACIEVNDGKHSKPESVEITQEDLSIKEVPEIKKLYKKYKYILPKNQTKEQLIESFNYQQNKSKSNKQSLVSVQPQVEPEVEPEVEPKEKVSIFGYPHIHMFVGMVSYSTGWIEPKLGEIIYALDRSKDVVVASDKGKSKGKSKGQGGDRKMKWDDIVKCSRYMFKNARHYPVMEQIYRLTEGYTYNPVRYYNFKKNSDLDNKFFMLREQNKFYPFDILDDKHNQRVLPYTKSGEDVSAVSIKVLKPEIGLRECLNIIRTKMERRNLYVCEGNIYEKITPYTYECVHSIGEFINQCDFGEYTTSKSEYIHDIARCLSQEITFSRVVVTGEFWEFQDGFYEISTNSFFLEKDERIKCHQYFEYKFLELKDMTDEQLLDMMQELKYAIIHNNISVQSRLYMLEFLMLRFKKCQNIVVKGVSNSGKTTITKPLFKLLPKGRLGEPQTGRFGLGEMRGKNWVISEEGLGIKKLEPELMLQLACGEVDLMTQQKYKMAERYEFKINFFIVSQYDLLGYDNSYYTLGHYNSYDLEGMRNRCNLIRCSENPIPADKQISNKHLDLITDEVLPYYFMWLIKSHPNKTIIKQKYEVKAISRLQSRRIELKQRVY